MLRPVVLWLAQVLPLAAGQLQQVLLLGGNGFIGSECAAALLAAGRYNVTVLSRGTPHYDVAERVWPHVARVTCDRYSGAEAALRRCRPLAELLGSGARWDFVVDFSGYDGAAVADALDALGDSVGFYVYISSDSVYEVCEISGAVLSPESSAVRPADAARRHRLAKKDSYGDGKLAGEEVLQARGVPHVALRLPDVLGPRDTTLRWWCYQLWLQHAGALGRPVPLPPSALRLRTSYVYVSDVARALLTVLERSQQPDVAGRAFNLALEPPLSLSELLGRIASQLGLSNNVTELVQDEDAPRLFPSVSRGPVSIARAKEVLGFSPTSWEGVVRDTVPFYRRALVAFPQERTRALRMLASILGDTGDRLLAAVEQGLLQDTFAPRQEL